MVRTLRCLLGRHTWSDWKTYKDGCGGTPGCDHYLRHCTHCPRWQHKLAEGKPRRFEWGGLFELGEQS